MATQYTQLPMIECSSCGKILGHLYKHYYKVVTYLTNSNDDDSVSLHDKLADGSQKINDLDGLISDDDTIRERVYNFLDKYYEWLSSKYAEAEAEGEADEKMVEWKRLKELYDPKALVSKALIMHRELTNEDLPLHKHERDPDCVRYCCVRMLLCDNSQANY